jgi:hypothetical protein
MSIQFETFRGTGGGAVTGGLVYKGSYNATTSSPSLVTATKGDFYIVSVAGTLAGVTLNVGDHIVFNQDSADPVTSAMFDVIDNTDAVSSVNGQTGVITLGASDVNALAIASNLNDLDNAGTARTNLGLGTSAILDSGTANGNVVVLDATGLPAVDGSQLTGVTSTDNTRLLKTANLNDLDNVGTARTNLGLGTSATLDSGTANGNVVVLDATGLPAVDGSQLTGVTSTDNTRLLKTANLNDLDNVGTARTNLGLGTSATLDSGTANGNVVVLDATGLPAVDGSQLTGVTSTDNTRLLKTANLNDLDNAGTARTNLGLGTSAVIDVGTGASQIVQLDGSSRLPAVDGSQLTNLPSSGGGFTYSAIVTGDSPVSGAVSTHYSANTSGGAITINLPALAGGNAGKEIRVKLKTAGNTLTIDGNASETIDGSTTYTLTVQNQAVTLVSDGSSNWEVI